MTDIGLECARSRIAHSMEEALAVQAEIGFPTVMLLNLLGFGHVALLVVFTHIVLITILTSIIVIKLKKA